MPTKIYGTTGIDKVEAGAVITDPIFEGNATINGTGYLKIPTGTTAQRPSSPNWNNCTKTSKSNSWNDKI